MRTHADTKAHDAGLDVRRCSVIILLSLAACTGSSTSDSGTSDTGASDTVAMTDGAHDDVLVMDSVPSSDVPVAMDVPSSSEWPGPNNTGVPAGTNLTAYGGPCTIDVDNTIIDSKTIDCDIVIHATNVTIQNSNVHGLVFLDTDLPGSNAWSLTLRDSEVDGGTQQRAAVSDGNMTIERCNIHGGETAVHCGEHAVTCVVTDSWLHGQYLPPDEPWHLGGFQSNGGNNVLLRHNNIICDHAQNALGEGCTGDLNLIPDFAVVTHMTIDHNYFGANIDGSYCTYGGDKATSPYPHADHVVYTNNVFARGTNRQCGAYGPVTGFNVNGVGNQWVNNTWEDDGSPVAPEL